ncbi:uncharacterized protein MONBRDRAFT_33051 [Monosiga brevicollis MX1]|uniref:Uncharacterized protein n=1 Tax=Monosiga brevicollis TaxID=81824 RepID=A9V390_MONBE|nr:uncharacterized protein MONBRDRAFT_33051 [Monosiga brevicollis MX1]EDQ88018.1 predicted protein [Monosiga brevicollis MX1]|eukprot:XP_001747094.1 hypothetical protein [Monosiga brevicollis MX1]
MAWWRRSTNLLLVVCLALGAICLYLLSAHVDMQSEVRVARKSQVTAWREHDNLKRELQRRDKAAQAQAEKLSQVAELESKLALQTQEILRLETELKHQRGRAEEAARQVDEVKAHHDKQEQQRLEEQSEISPIRCRELSSEVEQGESQRVAAEESFNEEINLRGQRISDLEHELSVLQHHGAGDEDQGALIVGLEADLSRAHEDSDVLRNSLKAEHDKVESIEDYNADLKEHLARAMDKFNSLEDKLLKGNVNEELIVGHRLRCSLKPEDMGVEGTRIIRRQLVGRDEM